MEDPLAKPIASPRSFLLSLPPLSSDVTTGWLMKMDAYNHIQLDTVHLGKERVPPEIVTERHQGLNVSPQYVENNTQQLIDLFSLPWACLLADVIQLFKDRNIS